MLSITSFVLALSASFIYSVTNQVDKHILEKYFQESGPGTLVLYSTLLTILSTPVFVWLAMQQGVNVLSDLRTVISIPLVMFDWYFGAPPSATEVSVLTLFAVSLLNVGVLICYLYALDQDDPAVVILFYQLVPVFTGIGGWWLLGEAITTVQFGAMALILMGTGFVSYKIDGDGSVKFRTQTVVLMGAASLFWATETILFKAAALEVSLIRALLFESIALTFVGVLIFVFVPTYRKMFLSSLCLNSRKVLGLNVTNELIYMLGNALLGWATLLSTAAFVMSTNTYQAAFVLVISIVVSYYRKGRSEYSLREITTVLTAIAVTGVGVWILLTSGMTF